jgi:hypothetical protein
MTLIELKKMKAELHRVSGAKIEMEIRIEEALDTIKRLEDNLKIQGAKEEELIEKIKEAENNS